MFDGGIDLASIAAVSFATGMGFLRRADWEGYTTPYVWVMKHAPVGVGAKLSDYDRFFYLLGLKARESA